MGTEVNWSYAVAFKEPRGNTLRWVSTGSQDVMAASRIARDYVARHKWGGNWLEYGHSKEWK